MKLLHSAHGIPQKSGGTTEDAWRVERRDETVIAVLADGLGSSKDGGEAARRATDMLVDYFLTRPAAWSTRRALREFVTQISRVLHQESHSRHGSAELLCTLSVVVIEGNQLQGLNVGDSPVFVYHRGSITQLTQNDSIAEKGLEHVLTQAIGLATEFEPHCWETTLENGDMILLCSDGVSTALSSGKIAQLLKARTGAHTIVSASRDAVAETPDLHDDASAIVLDIVEVGWRGSANGRTVEVLRTLSADQSIDSYRLIRPLQPEARVWLARSNDDRMRVLKFPPVDAFDDELRRDGFVREMWNVTRVDSPDFIRAEIPAEGSLRYYIMDYVEAPTLRDVLKKKSLPVEETVVLAKTLLRATQFLLSRDLAHGDLKPDNILLAGDSPTLKFILLDLGSAAEIFSVTNRSGTPSYLAPERFRGGALSERTEIFSIGVILYEVLTRTYPYGEIERFQTPSFERAPRRPSQLNAAIPLWLEAITLRALAANADDRYQNFSELVFDLDHPSKVTAFMRRDAPLLERNPLLFYKSISLFLLLVCSVLVYLLAHK